MSANETKAGGLHIPARTVPTPVSISSEAQAFLDRASAFAVPPMDVSGPDGIRKYIALMEGQIAMVAAGRAKPYPATFREHKLSKSVLYEVVPESLSKTDEDKAIFQVHGGGFIVAGGMTAVYGAQALASKTGLRVFTVDYRMPPDHPFPAALDDTLEAYKAVLKRYDPAKIAFHGSSAGANLAGAAILKARDIGLPLPGACVLHTAAMDLSRSGDSFATNAELDVVLRVGMIDGPGLYLGGHDPKDPYVSPVFGDMAKGFPPTLLISGTRDLLLSSTVMMHRVLRRAGIEAELHVFEAMPHGGFGDNTPEDRELMDEVVTFIRRWLKLSPS